MANLRVTPAESVDWRLLPGGIGELLTPLRLGLNTVCSTPSCKHLLYANAAAQHLQEATSLLHATAAARGSVKTPIFAWLIQKPAFNPDTGAYLNEDSVSFVSCSHEAANEIIWSHVAALECAMRRGAYENALPLADKIRTLSSAAGSFVDPELWPEAHVEIRSVVEAHCIATVMQRCLFERDGLLQMHGLNKELFKCYVTLSTRFVALFSWLHDHPPRTPWLPLAWALEKPPLNADTWMTVFERLARFYRVLGWAAQGLCAYKATTATSSQAEIVKADNGIRLAGSCLRTLSERVSATDQRSVVDTTVAGIVFSKEPGRIIQGVAAVAAGKPIVYVPGLAKGEDIYVLPFPPFALRDLPTLEATLLQLQACFAVMAHV